MPTLARIRGSGAYQPYIAARCSGVTISRVSSSWLRRKVPHCAPRRDRRGVGEHVDDRRRLLLAQRVVEHRHHREVEAHLALRRLLGAEVVDDVAGRLVGLGEQDAAGVLGVDHGPQLREERVRPRVVLAVVALLLEEVGHGVEPEAVDAHVHPEPDDVEHRLVDRGVLEVQVGLVAEEPVPEELPADRVEGPVRGLGVDEDDRGRRCTCRRCRTTRRSRRTGPSGSLRDWPGTTGAGRWCGS